MPSDLLKPRRRSIRLKGYDYSQAGAYFVTICAQDRVCVFGQIENQKIIHSPAGLMVTSTWEAIPEKFPSVGLDACVIMPNHIHFIIQLTISGVDPHTQPDPIVDHEKPVGVDLRVHLSQRQARRPAPTLPDIVGWFKSFTTAKYRHGVRDQDWPPFHKRLWQRNYWEHIIRNEKSLNRLRQYIHNNPVTWESKDQLHPDHPSKW